MLSNAGYCGCNHKQQGFPDCRSWGAWAYWHSGSPQPEHPPAPTKPMAEALKTPPKVRMSVKWKIVQVRSIEYHSNKVSYSISQSIRREISN